MAKKDMKLGTALIIAGIISSVQLRPKIRCADELIKEAIRDFKRNLAEKARGIKKYPKRWMGL